MTPRTQNLLTAFAVGAAVSGVASLVLKRQLETEFGAGARELEAHLTDRGGALRQQITHEATVAGRAAAMDALNDYGITPALVAQVQELADSATQLQRFAQSTGKSVQVMLTEIGQRADQIRRGVVRTFS